jgi:hypothetical protein
LGKGHRNVPPPAEIPYSSLIKDGYIPVAHPLLIPEVNGALFRSDDHRTEGKYPIEELNGEIAGAASGPLIFKK